ILLRKRVYLLRQIRLLAVVGIAKTGSQLGITRQLRRLACKVPHLLQIGTARQQDNEGAGKHCLNNPHGCSPCVTHDSWRHWRNRPSEGTYIAPEQSKRIDGLCRRELTGITGGLSQVRKLRVRRNKW